MSDWPEGGVTVGSADGIIIVITNSLIIGCSELLMFNIIEDKLEM